MTKIGKNTHICQRVWYTVATALRAVQLFRAIEWELMIMAWYDEAVFYHIYPLGFCGAPHKNSCNEGVTERILKIIDWIPHMKYLVSNLRHYNIEPIQRHFLFSLCR